jgi:peptidoglycan/LPS O-acetylase OafA/YrhL
MHYRRELDGLRAVAVIPVVLFHARFRLFSGGFVGVDVFFVISGYLITSIIVEEKTNNTFTLTSFYERRARRILPALFATVFVSIPLAWLWLLPSEMTFFFQSLMTALGFCSNVLFYHTSGYFAENSSLIPLIHTWSLAVEEQYYILFPALLTIMWRLGPRLIVTFFAIIATFSLTAAQHFAISDPGFGFFLLPTRGWEILTGCLIAFYTNWFKGRVTQLKVNQFGSAAGFILIAYSVFSFNEHTPSPSLYTLIPVLGAALIILFATETTLVGRILGLKPIVAIGAISYSLYLFHQPLLAFERQRELAEPTPPPIFVIILITLSLAYLSWHFIEQPFRNRNLITRPRVLVILSSATFFLLATSFFGQLTNGFPERFGKAQEINQKLFEEIGQERIRNVRSDVCEFSDITNIGIDKFLQQWNCKDDKSLPDLQKIPVIITGDSHSADKVIALKLNGLLPLQIGGSGCSIIPKTMSPNCKRIFEKLYDLAANDQYYRYLVLAHSFSEDELTSDSINEAVAYWRKFNKELIWFAGMPTFYRLDAQVEHGRIAEVDFRIAEMSQRDEIGRLLGASGVHIIDTKRIFCSINDCRYVSKDGCVLLTDDSHLSVWGARLFGRALLNSDSFFGQWANVAKASRISEDVKYCHKAIT